VKPRQRAQPNQTRLYATLTNQTQLYATLTACILFSPHNSPSAMAGLMKPQYGKSIPGRLYASGCLEG